jgi:hypothetical protein
MYPPFYVDSGKNYTYKGVSGFQGFILVIGADTVDYLGCALYVDVGHNHP